MSAGGEGDGSGLVWKYMMALCLVPLHYSLEWEVGYGKVWNGDGKYGRNLEWNSIPPLPSKLTDVK